MVKKRLYFFCSSSSRSNLNAPEVIEEQKYTEKSDVCSEMNQIDSKILNENQFDYFFLYWKLESLTDEN